MSDSKTNTSLYATFQAYLKTNGLRETYERRKIVDALAEHKGKFDLEQLALIMSGHGARISRATLYNTVALLVKAGLVRRQQFADGQINYECTQRLPAGNQLHTLCTECGKVADIRNSAVIRELSDMKFGTFNPQYISMTVYGICSRCSRRLRRQEQAATNQLKLFR